MRLSTYKKLSTELYDLEDPQQRQRILDFYLQQAENATQPFLEPMCGTGYFLLPFLQRGMAIDGLDSSPAMLQACQIKAEQSGLHLALYEQLLQELDLPRKYGYIFIPDRSFGHLYEKEVTLVALRKLYDLLLPHGKLLFDVAPPVRQWQDTGNWEDEWFDRPDCTKIVARSLVSHREEGRILHVLTRLERFHDGLLVETEQNEYIERFYERAELQMMLEAAGFIDIRVYKAFDMSDPGEQDRMVFLCTR
jgi:SAM-dependent methyltransferase